MYTQEQLNAIIAEALKQNTPSQPVIDVAALVTAIKGEDKGELHQCHGLKHKEVKQIKLQQQLRTVKMISGNKVSRYKFPEYEKDFIHFSVEKLAYKPDTDIKTSKPRFIVKTVDDFERMSKSVKEEGDKINPENAFYGLQVVILHDPRTGVKSPEKVEPLDKWEELETMPEKFVARAYFEAFGEEPLPSDSKRVMIDMMKEKAGV